MNELFGVRSFYLQGPRDAHRMLAGAGCKTPQGVEKFYSCASVGGSRNAEIIKTHGNTATCKSVFEVA